MASRDQIIPAWRAVCLPIPAAGSDRAPPPLFQPCCCVAALLSFAAIWWGFLRTLVLFPLLTTVVWSTGHQRMTRCSPSTLDGTMSPLPSTDPILAIHHPKLGILLEEHCDRVDNAECYLWIQQNPGATDRLQKSTRPAPTSCTKNCWEWALLTPTAFTLMMSKYIKTPI